MWCLIFFAADADLPVIQTHIAQGGRAVVQKGDSLLLVSSACKIPLANLHVASMVNIHIDYVLAAVAAAWALGISPDLISAGIKTFSLEPGDV